MFNFTDFYHFLELWTWKNTFIREPDDFTLIGEAVARSLQEQNIVYAETFYSPPDFFDAGLDIYDITNALRKGVDQVSGIQIRLIADLVRGSPLHQAHLMLDQLLELKDQGVIGIGLGGNESVHPPGIYKDIYTKARKHNFLTTVHAGEAVGPDSIWEALLVLKPHRIGHGVRAIEDEELLQFLIKHQIPLEVCPFSNVRTQIYPDYDQHPIRTLFDLGISFSVNSDDPVLFQTSISSEYQGLRDTHHFSDNEIQLLIISTIEQSFTSSTEKHKLHKLISDHPAWKISSPKNTAP